MQIDPSTAGREIEVARRAIALGYTITKELGGVEFPYVLQTESGLTLDQLEELLGVLERGAAGESPR